MPIESLARLQRPHQREHAMQFDLLRLETEAKRTYTTIIKT